MKKIMLLGLLSIIMYACNIGCPNDSSKTSTVSATDSSGEKIPNPGAVSSYDSTLGAGKFTHVDVKDKLDDAMASVGEVIYGAKCAACHKLTGEKLVGPGWLGVTSRHKPEWIMNFVTNTDEMLNKDPKAKALLEICLVRMPNQNLADNDARQLLEFMRKNDGVK
jgi:mono/diheme cytochrome c family protein